jgi:hypothetical protein
LQQILDDHHDYEKREEDRHRSYPNLYPEAIIDIGFSEV